MIKFSVAAFAEASKVVINIPGTASGIDILNHARIEAERNSLTITVSDLDIEARVTVECEADAAHLVAVPRAVLEFFIARAGMGDDPGTLAFNADMTEVTARHGKARLTLSMLPGDAFFTMNPGEAEWSFAMRAHELCEALRRTEKALGTDANRIMLHGPFLHRVDGALKLIGADGSRVISSTSTSRSPPAHCPRAMTAPHCPASSFRRRRPRKRCASSAVMKARSAFAAPNA